MVSEAGPGGDDRDGSGSLNTCALHSADKLHMMVAMMLVRRVRLCLCPFVKVSIILGLQIYCFYFVRVYYFVKFARMC